MENTLKEKNKSKIELHDNLFKNILIMNTIK
jgi:hypothetical protein